MSLTSLMVHDVTVVRAGSVETRYGDDVKDWSAATETTVKGWVSQGDRVEDVDSREAQSRSFTVFLPADTDVTGLDRLVWEGLTLEVVGPPNWAWNPRMNAVHHIELTAREVTG